MVRIGHVMPDTLVIHRGHRLHLAGEQIEDLVDDVGAPVEERTARYGSVGVPVVAGVAVAADECLDVEDLADAPLANGLANEREVGIEAAVLEDGQCKPRAACAFDQRIALLRGERHGLLEHDVLAVFEGRHRPGCMTVGRRGDDDDVDVGVREQRGRVGMDARIGIGFKGLRGSRRVAIADGHEMESGGLTHGPGMCSPDGAETEEPHPARPGLHARTQRGRGEEFEEAWVRPGG